MALYRMSQEPQNHVVFVLDESTSMRPHAEALVTLFDNEAKYFAKRSLETFQETRISVYLFSSSGTARCVLYDMDAIRVAESFSLKGKYQPNGMTALCDGVTLAIDDLRKVVHPYGQHSYWILGFTDGQENASATANKNHLSTKISSLPDSWTFSLFVPDQMAKAEAKRFGFPSDNIAIWDTTSVRGMDEVAKTVRTASESYFTLRSTGARGSSSLFKLNTVSTDQIKRNLTPLSPSTFAVIRHGAENKKPIWIRDLVQDYLPVTYERGYGYYELVKTEHIRPAQSVIIEQDGKYYSGSARELLGLPGDETVKVSPDYNPAYKIFVQSQSHNRNIIPGERVLYLVGNKLAHLGRTFF